MRRYCMRVLNPHISKNCSHLSFMGDFRKFSEWCLAGGQMTPTSHRSILHAAKPSQMPYNAKNMRLSLFCFSWKCFWKKTTTERFHKYILDRSLRNLDRSTRNLDRSMRNLDRSIRNLDRSILNLDRSIRNLGRSLRNSDRPVRNLDQSIRNLDRSIRNLYTNLSVVSVSLCRNNIDTATFFPQV
jgi:hypothetical protein